jgi:hypothetical protein
MQEPGARSQNSELGVAGVTGAPHGQGTRGDLKSNWRSGGARCFREVAEWIEADMGVRWR